MSQHLDLCTVGVQKSDVCSQYWYISATVLESRGLFKIYISSDRKWTEIKFSTRSQQQQLCGEMWRSDQLWRSYLLGIIVGFSHVTLFQRHLKKALSLQGLGALECKQEGRCFIQEVSYKWGKCDYDSNRPRRDTQACQQCDTLHCIDRVQ